MAVDQIGTRRSVCPRVGDGGHGFDAGRGHDAEPIRRDDLPLGRVPGAVGTAHGESANFGALGEREPVAHAVEGHGDPGAEALECDRPCLTGEVALPVHEGPRGEREPLADGLLVRRVDVHLVAVPEGHHGHDERVGPYGALLLPPQRGPRGVRLVGLCRGRLPLGQLDDENGQFGLVAEIAKDADYLPELLPVGGDLVEVARVALSLVPERGREPGARQW